MNIYKQIKTGNKKLLLVFSGWAASPEVFRHLETEPDTDLWICYDYRGMDFDGEAGRVWQKAYIFHRSCCRQWNSLPRP